MLLDTGICSIHHIYTRRGSASPVDGLTPFYVNWYGSLQYELGKGAVAGEVTRRIRIHDADVHDHDVVEIDGGYFTVVRVFHGADDDTGLAIADLTLAAGHSYFVPAQLAPRRIRTDELGTITSGPDTDNAVHVWINTGSVNVDEYYTAQAAGHTLSLRAEVSAAEYAGEPYVITGGTTYLVTRAEHRGSIIDLMCEAVTAWRG